MPSNKDRLYVALYVRGGAPKMPGKEDTYHWALLVGPKGETSQNKGTRYHARERMTPEGSQWVFEELSASMMTTKMILVRILIAKVEDTEKLAQLLRKIPIRQGEPGWNCVLWVKEALSELEKSNKIIGTSVIEWKAVRDAAMEYCQQKRDQHPFDGKGEFDTSRVSTFDLIQEKETIP